MSREPPFYPSYIEMPQYKSKWMIVVGMASLVLAIGAFALSASGLAPWPLWAALLVCLGVIATLALLIHTPFICGWGYAQWRRARSYDTVYDYAREITAEHALFRGVRRLPVIGLHRARESPEIVLDLRPANGVGKGEYLLIVDTVGVGVVGMAQVSDFRAGRCFAKIVTSEAVLGGYVQLESSLSLPDTIVLVREVEVRSITQKLESLALEAEP